MRLTDSLIEPVSSSKASSSTLPGPGAIFSPHSIRSRSGGESEVPDFDFFVMPRQAWPRIFA